ncbi:hypothetical protein D3C71_1577460 [compost metagenome]
MRAAGITPVNCITGSDPTTTRARNRARGRSPSDSAVSWSASNTAAAPSANWLALAAVTPPCPAGRIAGAMAAMRAASVVSRMPSSRCTAACAPGSNSACSPARAAVQARAWLSRAHSSISACDKRQWSAIRSALSIWWIRAWRSSSAGFSDSKPLNSLCPKVTSRNIGTRLMLSTPPATT